MRSVPCHWSRGGAKASTRPGQCKTSSKHRRALVSAAGTSGAGANLSVNLMKQCSILERTEVQLQSGRTSRHPFRVATFNVLADGLAQSGDFVKVPISCLMWEHRLPLILQEIKAADADIICLQELNHFDTLATTLVPEGYSCFFRAKKPSPALKFGFPADGIALFYRHSRFSCSPAPAGHCFDSVDGQPAAQGFVTAQLHDKLAGHTLIVAATHLKAKAGFENEQTRVHQVSCLESYGMCLFWLRAFNNLLQGCSIFCVRPHAQCCSAPYTVLQPPPLQLTIAVSASDTQASSAAGQAQASPC
eukprot:GHUV01029138.1.p1 GENE.GHUV01029138.1~~GHUV01029138.1.p1  ORF type:complete len:304 (+),score=44.01 GHUV01029138.1:593-1504(+)